MKLKTIIIILLIAAATYIGYKWYVSKKEDKKDIDPADKKNETEKVDLPEGYLEAKETIEQYFRDAKKDEHRIEIQYGRNKNEIAIFDRNEYTIIGVVKVASKEAFDLLNNEYHFCED